jgi:hypothetical protein
MYTSIAKFLLSQSGFYSTRSVLSGGFGNPIPFQDSNVSELWEDAVWFVIGSTPYVSPRLYIAAVYVPMIAGPAMGGAALTMVTGEVMFGEHEKSEVAFGESLYSATFDDSNRLRMQKFGSNIMV